MIRRSRCLVAFWEDGEFVVENYLTHRQTVLEPIVAQLLSRMDSFQEKSAVVGSWEKILPNAEAVIYELLLQTVLVESGSAQDGKEQHLEHNWPWGQDARYFHYATQHVVFESDPETQDRLVLQLAKQTPPPLPYKNYQVDALPLTDSFSDSKKEGIWQALERRRTHRAFDSKPLPLNLLSAILQWTWGKTMEFNKAEMGIHIMKTSPSGGSRHPVEVYPLVLNVESMQPGLYHYSVQHHRLEPLKQGDFSEVAAELCAGQRWVSDAAVVCLMTAVLPRSMWKYRHARAYRIIHLDAGHLGQTFHLVCTALGLGPFTTAAMNDKEIEAFLGIDGVTEIPIYVAASGWPKEK